MKPDFAAAALAQAATAEQVSRRQSDVRVEPRVRQIAPGRRIEKPGKPAVVVTQRGTTLESRVRPANEFTVEEQRIQLAATAGPLRRVAARIFVITVPNTPENSTVKLVSGKNCPIYVRVESALSSQGSRRVVFTEGGPGTEQTGVAIVLPDEGPFEAVLMPGEALFATLNPSEGVAGFQLKIYEVRV